MWSTIIVGIALILLWRLWLYFTQNDGMSDIPSAPSPWWELFRSQKNMPGFHVRLEAIAKEYGPIVKLPGFFGKPTIMVSSFDNIHEVFVKKGKEFGGRTVPFHFEATCKNTGILMRPTPDKKWKKLRMVAQQHMRHFGDGIPEMQSMLVKYGKSLISEFEKHTGEPFDPYDTIILTVVKVISQVMLGVHVESDDPIISMIINYESTTRLRLRRTLSQILLEACPWLRYFGNATWKIIRSEIKYSKILWKKIIDKANDDPTSKNIYLSYKSYMTTSAENKDVLEEIDAEIASVNLIQGAIMTTTSTLYAALNILSHHKHIQHKMYEEICNNIDSEDQISFTGRSLLPYCHATLLELLRYTSLATILDHKACTSTVLNGHTIPEGTSFFVNLWNLHYDKDFWIDPDSFRPERFVDESNEVVPADHPNRKHLLPFGGGPRVCSGETLALSRLFLWLVMIVKQFEILPAPGNHVSSSQPRNYRFEFLLGPCYHKIIFQNRE